jgi:hypothetical protein
VRVIISLALRGFNVSKLIFTNPQFNKMVLKTPGPPLHTTCPAYKKEKIKYFQKLHKNYKKKLKLKIQKKLKLKQVAYLPVGLVASW